MESADWYQSPEFRAAETEMKAQLRAFRKRQRDETMRQSERSKLVRRLLKAPTPTQRRPTPTLPAMVSFPPPKRSARTRGEAQRFLRVDRALCDRFVWHIQTVLPGEVETYYDELDTEGDDEVGVVPRAEDLILNAEDYRANFKENRINRAMWIAVARRSQRAFRSMDIPMNFAVGEGILYLLHGRGFLYPLEREVAEDVVRSQADDCGAVYSGGYTEKTLQFGYLDRVQSDAWLAERYSAFT